MYCKAAAAVVWGKPVIQKILVQFPNDVICCCFLEQETSLTLFQAT